VKVNLEKCQFLVKEVKYLGHILTREGVKPNVEKIKAILDAPPPQNVTQVKSFVGMVMFYSKFLKNLSEILTPLYLLLHKGTKFEWTEKCQKAFLACKKQLCEKHILTHYDPKKQIVITCDASDDGISGILSHRINGEEKPVFFASRTLTKAEKNYPILHRELLAIVFAMEKFYKYIFGHFVEIYTDHKPLLGILNARKGESSVIASRLQRYVIRLSIFDFELKYRKGKDNGNADGLSRLPISEKQSKIDELEEKICSIKSIFASGPLKLNIERIRNETVKDEKLQKLKYFVLHGWNEGATKEFKNFHAKNDELEYDCGCLLISDRIIVPKTLQPAVLQLIHSNHMGITRMKQIARKYVYWEGVNKDIENKVKECEHCQILRKDDQKKSDSSWPEAKYPFERVHIDFFHFQGREFLILVDAFSRWLEVRLMNKTNAQSVLKELQDIFNVFGYSKELVSDNGPPFSSFEFKSKLESLGIKVTKTPPYHPKSNGLVERAVQSAKSVLRKFVHEFKHEFQIRKAVHIFLMNYRNSPCTEEMFTPAEKIFKYTPRTELSSLKLDRNRNMNLSKENTSEVRINEKMIVKSELSKKTVENKSKQFKAGENVLYLSRSPGHVVGLRATVTKKNSEMTYYVSIDGSTRLAHVDQLRKSNLKTPIFNLVSKKPNVNSKNLVVSKSREKLLEAPKTKDVTPEKEKQRTKRTRKAPERLTYGNFK
jgi:hypothetical protein